MALQLSKDKKISFTFLFLFQEYSICSNKIIIRLVVVKFLYEIFIRDRVLKKKLRCKSIFFLNNQENN